MARVDCSINGHKFRDYGVLVSEYKGIADVLKRKPIPKYEWSEYHGVSLDLSELKFQERLIELKCFIIGDNWEDLFSQFNKLIRDEFSKNGTQRLMIEPFGYKPLLYEVVLVDEVELKKTFKEGQMVATFSLKLVEPNPIKLVLKTSEDELNISFNSSSEIEVFWGDGTKNIFRGDVNEVKDYHIPSYQSSNYSIVEESSESDEYEAIMIPSGAKVYMFAVKANINSNKNIKLYVVGKNKNTNNYEYITQGPLVNGTIGSNSLKAFGTVDISNYARFAFKVLDDNGQEIEDITFNDTRIEEAEILGLWQNMIGKTKYVIIAGDIDNINELDTNAEIVWTKL